jgi:hypothetical protein
MLAIGLLALGLGACSPKEASPESVAQATSSVEESSADAGVGEEQPIAIATASTAVAPRTISLVEQGKRRTVNIDAAINAVAFGALEPSTLPKGSKRTVVHLIEPIEGIDNPALPAIRYIYDLPDGTGLIIVQSPARGELGEGEDVMVGDIPGRLQDNGSAAVLVIERDGVNVELRGIGVGRDAILEWAAGLVPYGQAADVEEAPDGATEDADAATPEATVEDEG